MIPTPHPPKIVLEEGNRAVFEIEGLWPGYGHTVGNAIRRALLSSLEGAAITSVKIEGVQHEFSTLPGVLEDMVELTLNLKGVRFRMHGPGPYTATLAVKGEKEVTAADIKAPSQLEVVNPEQHIAVLTDKKAALVMDLVVDKGVGYQPVESRQKEKIEIGTIALDAAFSPLRLVNYEVENMRVGERTDFNRVRFHIETDGSVTPREAFLAAAKILQEQFAVLAGVFVY
ncbi:MAG: DNA-directed RNA polymerase subunit alpha, partial [Patescibacteria group bacterium]